MSIIWADWACKVYCIVVLVILLLSLSFRLSPTMCCKTERQKEDCLVCTVEFGKGKLSSLQQRMHPHKAALGAAQANKRGAGQPDPLPPPSLPPPLPPSLPLNRSRQAPVGAPLQAPVGAPLLPIRAPLQPNRPPSLRRRRIELQDRGRGCEEEG
jgi:hypothetical protein